MVPDGWKKKSLSDVTAVIDCKHRTPAYVESGIPLVSPGTIKWGALDLVSPVKRVSKDEYESLMDHCTIDLGDLVMSRNQSVGIASYVESNEPFVLGQDTVLIKPLKVDSKFVYYKLQSAVVQRSIIKLAGGSTFSRINLADIRKLRLSLPPLPEQKKIAQILSTWDKAITTTQQLLANSQQQKKALMQQLLTGKKRLLDKNGVRFSGEWRTDSLKNIVGKIYGGGTPSRDNPAYWNGLIPWVTVKDLIRSRIDGAQEMITSRGLKESSANLVTAGTVIIATRMAVGKTVVASCEVAINQDLKAINASEKVCSEYLFYWFKAHAQLIEGMGTGSTVKGVQIETIKSLKMAVPSSIKEQQKIAAVFSSADQEATILQQKIDALTAEKKALMQQLLTGKRRVLA